MRFVHCFILFRVFFCCCMFAFIKMTTLVDSLLACWEEKLPWHYYYYNWCDTFETILTTRQFGIPVTTDSVSWCMLRLLRFTVCIIVIYMPCHLSLLDTVTSNVFQADFKSRVNVQLEKPQQWILAEKCFFWRASGLANGQTCGWVCWSACINTYIHIHTFYYIYSPANTEVCKHQRQ